ncbi:MAG: polysaccharide biosynthesis C-terminal domain-containing protein, partial [Treponema sp.]|nr:polysaccharide biosynthesis C-terminal domain-containing protein [Treponema sp.]
FIALNRILAPAFYAQSDSRSPTLAGIISFGVNICLAAILVRPCRGAGIALALSLDSAVNTGLLLFFLGKNPRVAVGRALRSVLVYAAKLIVFSAIAVIPVLRLSPRLLELFAGRGRLISRGLPLLICAALYIALGLLLLFLTKDRQIRGMVKLLRKA